MHKQQRYCKHSDRLLSNNMNSETSLLSDESTVKVPLFPFSFQTFSDSWMGLIGAQADWRSCLIGRGPRCVKLTLTSRMLKWSVGSWAVEPLQSSRGRFMENQRLLRGRQSSAVKVMNLLSKTVTAQGWWEISAQQAKLLDSPAQVELQF